uniref:Uncharacterized protein n=1 Tax=Rhizophora mucronata TaxID=61149 RepID=A0A2P2Q4T9_RHIMU
MSSHHVDVVGISILQGGGLQQSILFFCFLAVVGMKFCVRPKYSLFQNFLKAFGQGSAKKMFMGSLLSCGWTCT